MMKRLVLSLLLITVLKPDLHCAQGATFEPITDRPAELTDATSDADALADQLALVRFESAERYRKHMAAQAPASSAAAAAPAPQPSAGAKRERSNSLMALQAMPSQADSDQAALTPVDKHFYRLLITAINQGIEPHQLVKQL